MDADLKRKWVKALRSGEYAQCRDELSDGIGFCCIGVGYQVLVGDVEVIEDDYGDPTDRAADILKLPIDITSILVRMNDDESRTFAEIADYIEQNL